MKKETHIEYKNYRNLLSTILKKSKQAYYNKYFQTNWNNINPNKNYLPGKTTFKIPRLFRVKNTWKGIKSVISLETVTSSAPTVIFRDNSNTVYISNTFICILIIL